MAIGDTSVGQPALAKTPLPSTPPNRLTWHTAAWFAALACLLFAPVIVGMVKEWYQDDDMGHGFFVPIVAVWIAWQKRDELARLTPAPNWLGLILVAWGGAQLVAGTLGVELFIARTAFVITLFGIVITVGGWPLLRVLAFPLFLLFFMVRIPAIIYNQITFPLQLFASQVAEAALKLLEIPVLREGNVLELAEQKLSVVEACSGIRSLLSLSFLSLVYGYFFDTKMWMRVFLFLATIPIAIAANAGRVTITGIITEYKPELAQGFMHSMEGWVIFMISLGILAVVHQITNRVYLAWKTARAEA